MRVRSQIAVGVAVGTGAGVAVGEGVGAAVGVAVATGVEPVGDEGEFDDPHAAMNPRSPNRRSP